MDHIADVGRLCGRLEMIELQHNGIALAALHTWVLTQKLGDEDTIRFALQRVVPSRRVPAARTQAASRRPALRRAARPPGS